MSEAKLASLNPSIDFIKLMFMDITVFHLARQNARMNQQKLNSLTLLVFSSIKVMIYRVIDSPD